ncbi:hypothetical protein QE418_000626 [Microbacterium testaceum]|nr:MULTISPECIES: hypothetical protein [Microbacterium]MDQ1111178.1 hypothetical protein [Microbacterium testaceum]MDR6098282.1 hypothetical protein [Microbacterium sp. SORGH_AS_0454]
MAELDPVRSFALSKALEVRNLGDSPDSIVTTASTFETYLTSGATS